MGESADLTLAVNTGKSLIPSMKPAQLHPAERMPVHGGLPFTSTLRGGATKTFPVQPSNLPASQKKSSAERHYFSHALETPFPQGRGDRTSLRTAQRPVRAVPLRRLCGCWGIPGAGTPCARQRGGVAAQPGPALRDSRHLPETYLTARHGAGVPACRPAGHGDQQRLGAAVPRDGKKKSFLWL